MCLSGRMPSSGAAEPLLAAGPSPGELALDTCVLGASDEAGLEVRGVAGREITFKYFFKCLQIILPES